MIAFDPAQRHRIFRICKKYTINEMMTCEPCNVTDSVAEMRPPKATISESLLHLGTLGRLVRRTAQKKVPQATSCARRLSQGQDHVVPLIEWVLRDRRRVLIRKHPIKEETSRRVLIISRDIGCDYTTIYWDTAVRFHDPFIRQRWHLR